MATLLSDDFNHGDSTTSPGTPDVGGPYTVRGGGVAGILGSRLYFSTISLTGTGSHLTFPAASNLDYQAQLWHTPTGTYCGLIFRWQDVNNFWLLRANDTAVQLVRATAGVYTVYAQDTLAAHLPASGGSLRVVTKGRDIWGYVGLERVLWVEDHKYNAAYTDAGIQVLATTQRFDEALAVDTVLTEYDAGLQEEVALAGVSPGMDSFVYKGRDTKTQDEGEEA